MEKLTDKNMAVLKNFAIHLKERLANVRGYETCGNLVNDYGKMKQCLGAMGAYGCYSCDRTGFECPECGDSVGKAGEFCSHSCRFQYYRGI